MHCNGAMCQIQLWKPLYSNSTLVDFSQSSLEWAVVKMVGKVNLIWIQGGGAAIYMEFTAFGQLGSRSGKCSS